MPLGTDKDIKCYMAPISGALRRIHPLLNEGAGHAAIAAMCSFQANLYREAAQHSAWAAEAIFLLVGRQFGGRPVFSPTKLGTRPPPSLELGGTAAICVAIANLVEVTESEGVPPDGVIHVARLLAEQCLVAYDCASFFATERIDADRVASGLGILHFVEIKRRGHAYSYSRAFGPALTAKLEQREAWPPGRDGHVQPDCLFMDRFIKTRRDLNSEELLLLADMCSTEAAKAHAKLAKIVEEMQSSEPISAAPLKQLIERTGRDWGIKVG